MITNQIMNKSKSTNCYKYRFNDYENEQEENNNDLTDDTAFVHHQQRIHRISTSVRKDYPKKRSKSRKTKATPTPSSSALSRRKKSKGSKPRKSLPKRKAKPSTSMSTKRRSK